VRSEIYLRRNIPLTNGKNYARFSTKYMQNTFKCDLKMKIKEEVGSSSHMLYNYLNHENQDIVGLIILKSILRQDGCGLTWIYLAQDREQRRALVYMVMNLRDT
jgi:hypothetical protein